MLYALLATTILMAVLKNVVSRLGENEFSGMKNMFLANAVISVIVFLMCYSLGGRFIGTLDPSSVTFALANAVFATAGQLLFLKAVAAGSVSISSLFYAAGFIPPTIWGVLYYHERVSAVQVVALIVLLISLYLGIEKTNDKKLNLKWFVFAFSAMIFSGLIGIMQKAFIMEDTVKNINDFLVTQFLAMLVISLIFSLIFKKNPSAPGKKRFLIFAALMGITTGLVNVLNIYLSGKLSSIIVFPVTNGAVIILTTVASWLIFRERLSMSQKISVLLGLISIVIIGIA